MRVNWVIAEGYQFDPTVDVNRLKNAGPFWGSWQNWRGCALDNVICYDFSKAKELLQRSFQQCCNFYVPHKHFQSLGRPTGVHLFAGDFDRELIFAETVISMYLVGSISDLVLLLGFDLSEISDDTTRIDSHRAHNYHGFVRSIVSEHSQVQWVLLDHESEIDNKFQDISNLTCDTMENVLKLLI